jgi:catechol 2,3-dioxygenase-like lactoylglutathione lyase family enzyme
MNGENATVSPGASRIHIGLEVADLARSIRFYEILFGQRPTKVRADYAKFEPTDPPVHLSMSLGSGSGRAWRDGCRHFGVQVRSSRAVERTAERFRSAGIESRVERSTACCHSVQDKVWVEDPDGNRWEVFVVLVADVDARAPEGTGEERCCAADPPAAAAADRGTCCTGTRPR